MLPIKDSPEIFPEQFNNSNDEGEMRNDVFNIQLHFIYLLERSATDPARISAYSLSVLSFARSDTDHSSCKIYESLNSNDDEVEIYNDVFNISTKKAL